MRWLIVLVVLAAVLAGSLPLLRGLSGLLDGDAARAVATAPGPARGAAPGAAPAREVRVAPARSVTVYRWRAPDGTIHVESAPPASGVRAEAIELRAAPVAEPVEAPRSAPAPGAGTGGSHVPSYSAEGIDALVERVEDTAQALDARRRTMRDLEKDL